MQTINRSIVFFLLVSVMSLHGAGAVITTLDQFDLGPFGGDAAWLKSGGTTYLAFAGRGGGTSSVPEVEIYTFDGSSLTNTGIALNFSTSTILALAWLQSGGNDYLAVGGGEFGIGIINIYIFDGSSLTLIDTNAFGTGTVDVEWLQAADGSIFLAAAGFNPTTNNLISVYSFDGFSLTFLDGADYSAGGYGVGWLQAADGTIYLASAGNDTPVGDIRVFTFDGTSLTFITGINFGATPAQARRVAWLQTPDGSIFLAGTGNGDTELIIYSFNGSTLTTVATDTFGAEGLPVKWLQIGGLNLLAFGTSEDNPAYRVYSFNGTSLSLLASGTIVGSEGHGLDWLQIDNILFLGVAGTASAGGGGEGTVGRYGVMEVCIAPIANNDSAIVIPDTPKEIDVVGNDTLFCSSLVDTLITPPTNGMAVVNSPAGNVTYTSDPGFFGTDSLVYELCDQFSQCDQATVQIIVVEPGSELQLGPNVALEIYPAAVLQLDTGLDVNG